MKAIDPVCAGDFAVEGVGVLFRNVIRHKYSSKKTVTIRLVQNWTENTLVKVWCRYSLQVFFIYTCVGRDNIKVIISSVTLVYRGARFHYRISSMPVIFHYRLQSALNRPSLSVNRRKVTVNIVYSESHMNASSLPVMSRSQPVTAGT